MYRCGASTSSVCLVAVTTRLRKKCMDCGTRGNWPKTLLVNTCPKCTEIRLHHDSIRRGFHDKCTGAGIGMCHPTESPMCPTCAEYFASDTHEFFRCCVSLVRWQIRFPARPNEAQCRC